MAMPVTRDVDFIAAKLHGRRGELADGARLDALCSIRTVGELARRILPGSDRVITSVELQRIVVAAFGAELRSLENSVPEEYAAFFAWQRKRLSVENLKVAVRGAYARKSAERINECLVQFDGVPEQRLIGAFDDNASFFAGVLDVIDEPVIHAAVDGVRDIWDRAANVSVLETAVDCGYFVELLRLASLCPSGDGAGAGALAEREAGAFLVMFALRSKWNYGLPENTLSRFFFDGTYVTRRHFDALVYAPSLDEALAVASSLFRIKGILHSVADVESIAWGMYLREANRIFRHGHMEVGALVGYIGIRRIEVANLITLSEGLRLGIESRQLRARLIPRAISQEYRNA